MTKFAKLSILFGITVGSVAVSLPFVFLSKSQKAINDDQKSIFPSYFKDTLKSESSKVIAELRQSNVKSFSSTDSNTKPYIKDFSKFEKDFQQFIDKISQNPDLDAKKLAKEMLEKKGISSNKIKEIFDYQPSNSQPKANKITNLKPQTFSNNSPSSMTMEDFANKLWKDHVTSASFAAINFGLAVGYGFGFMFGAAASSAAAGGMLTWLSVEYKQAYNSLVYDKDWSAIKTKDHMQLFAGGSSVLSWKTILTARSTIKKIKAAQSTARATLLGASLLAPQVKIALVWLDVFQSIVSIIIEHTA
ncbi:hypothetical protein R7V75_00075 [Mesomycoplasma ovipneumoniae]|uniref:Uncharacterized protein n=4 Tax=Mesomycoplasma ovipneumoniae TaxID=29562 RepID=A0AAJ2P5E9_9BACT|nr:hypothetical protein [Mesomycoplasma ovipneumoniae]MDW2834616.1 hypothetical protein [Mesomycoplasma ovipneumoniae]MDW2835372.1 hypothetical protein [Mesomycoplasma ovipneumoniae]MDW2852704.1 hypothetical protein [Mesomycoplasma ovipneumoniae]MDW2860773.1 hypothetical protein [Mesomycoplasma ovipneumoniae]MDW2861616.1 hypothetical protein [Mesomycoplasma ovipneumoniae]